MLEIIIYGGKGRAARLELTPGTTLSLVETSPHFDDDLSEGTYSYPVEIPVTGHNSKILGAPEMLETPGTVDLQYWTIDVRDNGIPVLTQAKLTLLGHKGSYKYENGVYIMTVSGAESLLGTLVAGKTLKNLSLGGPISTGAQDPREFADQVMKGLLPQYNYLGFAPVYWPDFIDITREDYTVEFIDRDIVNDLVVNGAYTNGWKFGVHDPSGGVIPNGGLGYSHYRLVPFLQLHFILRKIFTEFGYTLFGEFLQDADYAKLFVFNNFAVNIYNGAETDISRFIYPQNHVPDIPVVDLLRAISKVFNVSFFFCAGRMVEMVYRKPLLQQRSVNNVTDVTIDTYEAEKPEIATAGIKLNWSWDQNDDMVNDRVKTIDLTRVRASVPLYASIAGISLSPAAAEGDLLYVIAENAYYSYTAGAWTFCSDGQQDQLIGKAEKDFDSKISTLTGTENCRVRMKGSYYTMAKTIADNPFGLRIFYIGKYNSAGATGIPVSHTQAVDPATGTKRVTTSLSFSATDGLYYRHHKSWIDAQQKGWSVKAYFNTLDIGLESKLQIKNVQYIVQQLKPVIGKDDPMETLLLRI